MKMFHLAFLLDEVGNKRINLISFYELSKLDDYIIKNFESTKDVRKRYDKEIGEFCLDNRKFIQDENKRNNRNWTGSVAIICEYRDQNDQIKQIHKIPIIYAKDNKLLSKKACLKKIKDLLKDYSYMRTIHREKNYLLTDNERNLFYVDDHRIDNVYMESCIGNFYYRLKQSSDEDLYYNCRTLMHLFKLNELTVRTKFGKIDHINENIPHDISLSYEKPMVQNGDVYLEKVLNDEDYEELFNTYSVDEINNNTDLFDEGRIKIK